MESSLLRHRASHTIYIALLALISLISCSDDSDHTLQIDEAQFAIGPEGPTPIPSSPPICDKNISTLRIFADYSSSLCARNESSPIADTCLPSCSNSACPAGTTCMESSDGQLRCQPDECTIPETGPDSCQQSPSDGLQRRCNPTTLRCELVQCADDTSCPCGSYCERTTNRCRMSCLTGNGTEDLGLGCPGGQFCGTRGRCLPTNGTSIPAEQVKLTTEPGDVELQDNGNGTWPITSVTVKLTTTNGITATRPPATVKVEARGDLQLACSPGDSLSETPCTIAGWQFSQQGVSWVAERQIRFRVTQNSETPQWSLHLTANDLSIPEPVTLMIARVPRQEQAGRYSGTLLLAGEPASLSIPVQATVTSDAIALHDSARIVASSGNILLRRDETVGVTSFLGGPSEPQLYEKHTASVVLHNSTLTYEPFTGRLTGELSIQLASSPSRSQRWSFSLVRKGDLNLAPCPVGETLDTALGACIPGAVWDPAPEVRNTTKHARANAWLNAIAPQLADNGLLVADGTVPLAERLLCYNRSSTLSNPGLSNSTLPNSISGDLACTGPNGLYGMWGIGLISEIDRPETASTPKTRQFEMFASCMQQIARTAPQVVSQAQIDLSPSGNDRCVSLARFYPALFSVAGAPPHNLSLLPTPPTHDRRSRLLFMRLLQQWSQLTGFVARQGTAQRGVSDILQQVAIDPPNNPPPGTTPPARRSDDESALVGATLQITYRSILEAVDDALLLFLDQSLHYQASQLSTSDLTAPDYRALYKPLAYWTFLTPDRANGRVNDVVGSAHLSTQGACGYSNNSGGMLIGAAGCFHSAEMPPLNKNLTVSLRVPAASTSGPSILVSTGALQIEDRPGSLENSHILIVRHWNAAGGIQTVTFKHNGGPLILSRDTHSSTYTLVTGNQGEHVIRVAYPSMQIRDTPSNFMIGSDHAGLATFLRGELQHVAIWDSALSVSEMKSLASAYSNWSNPRPAWESNVTPPDCTAPNAYEACVGLPASLLESLIPTSHLVSAYMRDQGFQHQAACRSRSPNDGLHQAKLRAGRSLRLTYAIQELAESMYQTAFLNAAAPPWQDRYDQARSQLNEARAQALATLTTIDTCDDPMGLAPDQSPLFFGLIREGDPRTPIDLMHRSATFLRDHAISRIERAKDALNSAREAWVARFTAGVQQDVAVNNATNRLDDIRASFGRELVDLCGIPVSDSDGSTVNAAAVMQRFLSQGDAISAGNCHIKEVLACHGKEQLPLDKLPPECLRGQIGEALLAASTAFKKIAAARLAWQSAIDVAAAWQRSCSQRQGAANAAWRLDNELRNIEAEQAEIANAMTIFWGAAGAIAAAAGGATAGAPGPKQMFESFVALKDGIAERKQELARQLSRREFERGLEECWHAADLAEIPLAGAEQAITIANSEFTATIAHVTTLRNRANSTVREASAALDREESQPRPRLAFHYWADENLEIYQRRMERARRITYLFLRAVEYDHQRNFHKDDAVLTAAHPEQLGTVAEFLTHQMASGNNQLAPEPDHVVLSLCKDILRLPQRYNEDDCQQPQSSRRFREILFSPANALFEDNHYMGQSLPFTLSPELAGRARHPRTPHCAERLAQASARFLGELDFLQILLYKREAYYSQTCGDAPSELGEIQYGTLRSSQNILLNGDEAQFEQDRHWVATGLGALPWDLSFETLQSIPENSQLSLAGRGLYGDYAVVVPYTMMQQLSAQPESIDDILIRLDHIGRMPVQRQQPDPTPPLQQSIASLDDNGVPIAGNPGGNRIDVANCCTRDTVANLTAVPAEGWSFGEWTGACTGSGTSCSILMSEARAVRATFIKTPLPTLQNVIVTRSGNGRGTVSTGWGASAPLTPSSPTWTQRLTIGSTVTLMATPDADSIFTGWSGGGCTSIGACVVPVQGDKTITATFTAKPLLTINISSPGAEPRGWFSVVRIAAGVSNTTLCENTSCVIPFTPGEQVQLRPQVNVNDRWGFLTWTGDCTTPLMGTPLHNLASCHLTMTANKTVNLDLRRRTTFNKDVDTFTLHAYRHGTQEVIPICFGISHICPLVGMPIDLVWDRGGTTGWNLRQWTGAASQCPISSTTCTITVVPNTVVGTRAQGPGGNGEGGGSDGPHCSINNDCH